MNVGANQIQWTLPKARFAGGQIVHQERNVYTFIAREALPRFGAHTAANGEIAEAPTDRIQLNYIVRLFEL